MAEQKDIAATDTQALGHAMAVKYSRMVANSVGVLDVVDRTYEIPRDEVGRLERPPGLSDAEWNLHCDAMLPSKDRPTYLQVHINRVELAHKIAGDRSAAPPELAKMVVQVLEQPKREYEVIDVTPEETK